MKRVLRLIQNLCRQEALLTGILLVVLLTFGPGLFNVRPLWLQCVVWYLLPAVAAVCAALACYDVAPAALGARGLVKSVLLSAPVAVFCAVNIVVGEFGFHENVILAAFTGVSEEFIYRLMLYPAMRMYFQDSGHAEGKAVVWSSLLFGLAHLSNLTGGAELTQVLFQCCYTAVIGLLFVSGFRKSGCIWGSVIWHVLLNMTGILFA